ncbi:MAG: hypothetical protein NZ957_03935 [Thaumarchaeota archaeon]|nr:hypothetical protein [Candidatus Calditenuaceae archaeon]MDW8041809.1 hypothetical protein [Nitrososphaerota archaeon]
MAAESELRREVERIIAEAKSSIEEFKVKLREEAKSIGKRALKHQVER